MSAPIVKTVTKLWKKTSTWGKLFAVALIITLLACVHRLTSTSTIEGFEVSEEFVTKKGTDIYDDFYVSVYDDLMFSNLKNQWEIGKIVNSTSPTKASFILDVGSGTGHHVNGFKKLGYKAAGIDISPAMVQAAKENYPDAQFQVGDVTKAVTFGPSAFTHITCLYFTIYYIKNKRQFFRNCMQWLIPGGYLVLHLVDREKFDPILPIGEPFLAVDVQKYLDKRVTSTHAKFANYTYKANFDLKGNEGQLAETFKNDKTGAVRKNELTLYMEPQSKILSMAKDAGFILVAQIDMKECQYDNQYLYILQKPQ